jgi:hypothetical protein
MLNYQLIKFEKENIFSNDIDLSQLDNNINSIFIVGIDTLSKIEGSTFPIKNRKTSIKQILTLLKYIDCELDKTSNDCVEIHYSKLIEIFNRDTYVKFMKLLNDLNIVYAVPYKIEGIKDGVYYNAGINNKFGGKLLTKRYKINENYNNEDLCIVIIEDKKKIEYNIDGNYNRNFIKTIKEVEVDIKSAVRDEISYMKSYTSFRKRLNVLFSLYDNRFIKKGRKVDRIYHSLSNISRVSRKHLTIKNKEFNNIDVVNCQPLLLCYYLKKNNLLIDENYIKDCELGTLYENFIIEGIEYIDYEFIIKSNKIVGKKKNIIKVEYNNDIEYKEVRDKIKVLLYKSIFFDFKTDTDIANKFGEIYPYVYKELEKLYKDRKEKDEDELKDKCKIAGELQNIEAEIFNNLIPTKSKYFFTLFDAIYFTSIEDAGMLMLEVISKFNKMGLFPKIKINDKYETE